MAVARPATAQQLDSELRAALAGNDAAVVEDRIEQMRALRGAEDPYLLQIEATWRMRTGDNDQAERLLNTVLQRDPLDLSANLNLAVLEAGSGRLPDARDRIVRLQLHHPNDPRVRELSRKLW